MLSETIRQCEGQPISRQLLLGVLKDYKRPQDKISDLVAQGILQQVKAKMYVPGKNLKMAGPEPFLLANHLAGPSYVSMESALAYWRLIPEKVFGVTSMINGRGRVYEIPAATFSYIHLPLPYFAFGQVSVMLAERQVAIVASAEKALCDQVIATKGLLLRSIIQTKEWLLEDMRMEREVLRDLRINMINEWIPDAPKSDSLRWLVKTLENL